MKLYTALSLDKMSMKLYELYTTAKRSDVEEWAKRHRFAYNRIVLQIYEYDQNPFGPGKTAWYYGSELLHEATLKEYKEWRGQ